MIDFNGTTSIITLNINSLNTPKNIEIAGLDLKKQKQDPIVCCL